MTPDPLRVLVIGAWLFIGHWSLAVSGPQFNGSGARVGEPSFAHALPACEGESHRHGAAGDSRGRSPQSRDHPTQIAKIFRKDWPKPTCASNAPACRLNCISTAAAATVLVCAPATTSQSAPGSPDSMNGWPTADS